MIWLLGAALAAEPLDVRGLWVADTVAEAHRPIRLYGLDGGQGWDAGFLADTARLPLQELDETGAAVPVVDLMSSAHVYGGWTWRGRRLSASLPVTAYGHDLSGGFAGLGDLQLSVLQPLRPVEPGKLGMGMGISGFVPTGDAERWSGSPGLGASAVASIGQEAGRMGWVANAGVRLGRAEAARNLLSGAGPVGGIEGHVRVLDDVVLGVEVVSQGAAGFRSVPVEAGLSARYRHPGGGFATLGGAYGVGSGVGASGGRVMLSVGYGGGRKVALPPPETIVVPVMVSQHRSELRIETPVAELIDNKIVLYQQIFFAEASAELLDASSPVLEAVRDIVTAHDEVTHLLIEGHTNARGSRSYNQRLSEDRAAAVAAWLIEQGLPSDMILTRGFGEDRPLVDDAHPDAMAINRRVEFTVLSADTDEARVPDADALPPQVREQEP